MITIKRGFARRWVGRRKAVRRWTWRPSMGFEIRNGRNWSGVLVVSAAPYSMKPLLLASIHLMISMGWLRGAQRSALR